LHIAPTPPAVPVRHGGAIALALCAAYTPADSPWGVRAWRYHILAGGTRVGTISLRDGHTRVFTHLVGHIGFAIDAEHRGHGYSGLAVLALLPEARRLMDTVWITTTPDNAACRRALERIGCVLVEAVDIPPHYVTYAQGERTKLRYRLDLSAW
jgi:predicted acetyltransferase